MDKCQWRCDHCDKLMDDPKVCCKAFASAVQSDERAAFEALPYVERFSESDGEGGGVYPDRNGNFVRYSDYEALARATAPQATVKGDEPRYTQADMERYGKCYADARDARRAAVPQADSTLTDEQIERIARNHGTGGWQSLDDMIRFARALLVMAVRQDLEIQRGHEYDWAVEEVRDLFPGSAGNGQ